MTRHCLASAALAMAVAGGAAGAEPAVSSAQPIAWTQRSVPVGPTSSAHPWRCSIKRGDTVYFATGYTEIAARQPLEARFGVRVWCDVRPTFPFGRMF